MAVSTWWRLCVLAAAIGVALAGGAGSGPSQYNVRWSSPSLGLNGSMPVGSLFAGSAANVFVDARNGLVQVRHPRVLAARNSGARTMAWFVGRTN